MTWTPPTEQPRTSLPPRLRAGDAHQWTVATELPAGFVLFYVLNGVINNTPTQLFLGGNGAATTSGAITTYAGVAVDATGQGAFALASATTAAYLPGKYQWVLFAINPADGSRFEIAEGQVRIDPNPTGAPIDPRSYNQRVLAAIRCAIAGSANSDVQMYKIGGREVTKMPRLDLLKQEAIFEGRVKRELRRKGVNVPSDTIGIRFGGGS